MAHHSERDVLRELFPETARELFGEAGGGRATLGLFPVAETKLAFVHGDRLLELDPVEPSGKAAHQCDLCHVTKSRHEVGIYRAELAPRRYRYVTLCLGTKACQARAGHHGLVQLAEKLRPN